MVKNFAVSPRSPHANMAKLSASEVEVMIKTLSSEGHGPKVILKRLKGQGISTNLSSIYRIRKCIGDKRQKRAQNLPLTPKSHPRRVRSNLLIKKVNQLTSMENPPSQNYMDKQLQVSPRTIRRVIHEDLGKVTHRKVKVHALTRRHIENRKWKPENRKWN